MDYAQFIAVTKKRNRLVYTWLAVTGVLVTAAIILLVLQEMSALWPLMLSCLLFIAIIVESVIILSRAFATKRSNYELFQNNTIIINKDTAGKLRKTDTIAIEKHEGDLKHTLQYLTTTPDLTRAERMDYIMEWHDYERDFIIQQYGTEPHRVAKVSRKLPLYIDGKEYIRAVCIKKYTTPSTDSSDSEDILDFGSHGTWKVTTQHL